VTNDLAHYGVKGMRWDHRMGPQNAPFIQRQGQAQQPPSGGQRPQFTPQERADKMAQLIQLIHASQAKATADSAQEAKDNPSPQATATHAANTAHLAQMAQAAKDATTSNAAHKAANAKKPASHPANKAHAAKMTAKANAAAKAHAAHKAKHPAKKTTTHKPAVKLNAKQKAELAKLSPAERTALAKLSPHDRAVLAKMTPQQKKALSHLSQKQKDALHKAQLASAAKRHKEALARKAAKAGSSAQHSDPVDEFLEHFGVKGMHWGVRKVQAAYGFGPDAFKTRPKSATRVKVTNGVVKSAKFASKHKKAVLATAYVGQRAYANREKIAGTVKIAAHVAKYIYDLKHTPKGQQNLALGRAFVQGQVIHTDSMEVDEFLEHFGVKGMHWGVRRDRSSGSSRRVAKADRAFEYVGAKNIVAINNKAADAMNNHEIPRINAKPQYKKADFTHDSPLRRKYYAEYASTLEKHLNLAADELGTNASGTRKYSVKVDPESLSWHVTAVDVKHAEDSAFTIKPKVNSKGLIVSFEKMTDTDLTQTDTDVNEFLAHHGVKGMHWGVRRHRVSAAGPSSADHHAVVGLGNKINSHGGIHALSNDELQKVITRLNLEQSYHRLTSEPGNADKGRAFVKKAISDTKLALDAVNTANQVKKAFEGHASAGPKHQSKRTRNAPLKVVSIR
jgi:hypothetical protein